jgi:trimethylamine:corrinoid methyltransferase-like protein
MVKFVGEDKEVQCGVCYTCQLCVTCEKYGEIRGQPAPQQPPQEQRMPVIRPPPMPMQPLTAEEIRRIVKEAMLEVLVQLGLAKPSERKREIK